MNTKITESTYSVGVLNPNMRIFDVVMRTEYGTSYNAYVVKGREKTALIETSHHMFSSAFEDNIRSVCPGGMADIDYVILNHNEPDHSGALAGLVSLKPDITVVVSQAGAIYIDQITNCSSLNKKVVKDGDTLDLGGLTLRFISAPFLHWPDTMFTWLEEEQVLFSCDFLGAHFCEPLCLDTRMVYVDQYKDALKYYFDCIMGPFKPFVQKGLEKIKDLDIRYACTSHGPVLSKEGMLPYALEMYRQWSEPVQREKKLVPVFYCSAYGNTGDAAREIVNGMQEAFADLGIAADTPLYDINEYPMQSLQAILNQADGFLIGSPTINRNAVPPVWILLSHIDAVNCAKKPVATFGSYGWSGEALGQLNAQLKGLKCNVISEGLRFQFVPGKKDLEQARGFGMSFVKEAFV